MGSSILNISPHLIFQHFSSGYWHLSNQTHDFQDFVTFPLCAVLYPKCCFKLIKIYHWLLVSNNKKCFLFQVVLSLFHFKGKFLVRENTSWKYFLQKFSKNVYRDNNWFKFSQIYWPMPLICRTSMCVVKTKHMWELPLITWTFMCVFFTTHVWFLSNTKDLPKCLVKTTHVCENPNRRVYFQIQGGTFCICIWIWQISLKYLT